MTNHRGDGWRVLHDTSRVRPRLGRAGGVRSETPRRCLLLFASPLLCDHLLFLRALCSLCWVGTDAIHSCSSTLSVMSRGLKVGSRHGAPLRKTRVAIFSCLMLCPLLPPSPRRGESSKSEISTPPFRSLSIHVTFITTSPLDREETRRDLVSPAFPLPRPPTPPPFPSRGVVGVVGTCSSLPYTRPCR